MVNIYKNAAATYFVPSNEAENDEILKNPIPGDLWVNIPANKRLPVYARLDRPSEDEIPRNIAADCAVLLRELNPKKQFKELVWCRLNATASFAKLDKATVKVFKASPSESDALIASKRTEKIDFEQQQQQYLSNKTHLNSQKYKANKKSELETSRAYQELAEQNRRGYTDLFDEESMEAASNQDRGEDWEDDFM